MRIHRLPMKVQVASARLIELKYKIGDAGRSHPRWNELLELQAVVAEGHRKFAANANRRNFGVAA